MDETETVVLCVCVTMSQEDMILSHVYLYVYVVSLITELFYKFKPWSLLHKRRSKPIPKAAWTVVTLLGSLTNSTYVPNNNNKKCY